jgi:hypothetical protein
MITFDWYTIAQVLVAHCSVEEDSLSPLQPLIRVCHATRDACINNLDSHNLKLPILANEVDALLEAEPHRCVFKEFFYENDRVGSNLNKIGYQLLTMDDGTIISSYPVVSSFDGYRHRCCPDIKAHTIIPPAFLGLPYVDVLIDLSTIYGVLKRRISKTTLQLLSQTKLRALHVFLEHKLTTNGNASCWYVLEGSFYNLGFHDKYKSWKQNGSVPNSIAILWLMNVGVDKLFPS